MTSKDTVAVLIEIHANAGQERQARDALLHAIQTSDKPGLVSSTEYEDLDDSGAFYAVQVWESEDAFHAHMKDAAENGMNEAIKVLREPPKTAVLRALG
ncbi:putative quinol monooxygenase [Nocardia brasiliensis]|uniref:Antibiotic biosynthesis monooxygenase n=1 Tax=Nocardia brasiliensis (strain ATCC 700358 / HUJEG-1) TaxID=1133849 RepID=K0EVK1_NOCB7|nr:antibiotic biosynthesis monooxygenase family protein [Nocardia brasiliensis]AFU03808.1 antibiotic biosynthesis monooxygenase [Nocardia brasiliensis ATCC 700358]OCF89469.1 antibiotic biosynthesis monooxygenase [Nocardia brasiliensis]